MSPPLFNFQTRQLDLERLTRDKTKLWDAVIIGGGIVGAGLARELAIRGLKPLLVEKNDFASGTSSRSSKLIHGGLRYLEMGDFHLVFEALSERQWLLKTHPHLVSPVEFNIPIFESAKAPPGSRSSALLGMGLWLYDALTLFRTPFFHGKHSAAVTQAMFPKIKQDGLKGSYYYADAMMLDDEMVLETLLDANRRGGTSLNYVEALSVNRVDGVYDVALKNNLSDAGHESLSVRAKEVIVCVGPWTQRFGANIEGGSARQLKPSKGVHLIIPWNRFPVEQCLVMNAPDKRIMFAIPRKDMGPGAELTIIGTTDSPYTDDPQNVRTESQDAQYLLKIVNEYFPTLQLTEKDIVMSYAGVRPLIDEGEASEAKTSREHEIWRNEKGVVFMAGGKYTTFRRISQEIANFAFPKSPRSNAESLSVLSSPQDYNDRLKGTKLWGKYTDDWIRWKLHYHCPCTLEDVVFRRLPLWMGGRSLTDEVLLRVGELAAEYFAWDKVRMLKEIEIVKNKLKEGYNIQ